MKGNGIGLSKEACEKLWKLRPSFEKTFLISGRQTEIFIFRLSKVGEPEIKSLRKPLEEIFYYFGEIPLGDWIQFLLSIEDKAWNKESIGDSLHSLGLIPDSTLGLEESKTRARLNFNAISSEKLSDFNRTIFERLKDLPLEKNSIQKEIIGFLKEANEIRNKKDLVKLIADKYPNLNFSNWPIPDLNVKNVRLSVEELKSSEFKNIDGIKCLIVPIGKVAKFKARVTTIPEIKTIQELAYFRVVLMASNGAAGEFVQELKKIKTQNAK